MAEQKITAQPFLIKLLHKLKLTPKNDAHSRFLCSTIPRLNVIVFTCYVLRFLVLVNIKRSRLFWFIILLSAAAVAMAAPEFNVEGVKGNVKSNIQAHVDFANEKCDLPAWRQRGLLRSTEQNTRNALKALGYYQPQVQTQFEKTEKCWKITSTVTLGEPVLIEAVA